MGVAFVCKILFPTMLAFILWAKLKRSMPRKKLAYLILLCFLSAIVANKVSGYMPPLTDEVTLTALGEKNSKARKEEVFLQSFTVDGENVSIGNPVSGKWFFIGDTYAWRVEEDLRQPKGTTRTVTLKVPVGWERTANFSASVWRGQVEIATAQQTKVVDTYADEAKTISVELGKSSSFSLILNQVLQLAVYVSIAFLGAWGCLRLARTKIFSNADAASKWWKRYGGKAIYSAIAFVAFWAMVRFADRQSFWNDEIAQLGFASGTVWDAIRLCLRMGDITPPLFTVFANIWYKLAPYGQKWLLLLNIVPTALMVHFAGLIGERLRNRFSGVLTASLLAFSATIWSFQAYEFRSYAFMGLFSTLSLYCFIRRNEAPQIWKWHILFGFSLTALAMSHYFGMLACGCIFLVDALLFFRKKLPLRSVSAYGFAGGVSLAWLVSVYIVTLSNRSTEEIASWYSVPTPKHVELLLFFLTGNQTMTWVLFLLAIATAAVVLLMQKNSGTGGKVFYYLFFGWMCFFPIAILYIYGNYVNQASTMWQERYFLFMPIYIAILTALGIDDLLSRFVDEQNYKMMQAVLCSFLVLLLSMNIFFNDKAFSVQPPRQAFREAADWLNNQANYIYNEDTLVLTTMGYEQAWEMYFIEQQGRRDPVNASFSQYEITEADLEAYNRIYLQYAHAGVQRAWLRAAFDVNFAVVEEHPELQITVYQRKEM